MYIHINVYKYNFAIFQKERDMDKRAFTVLCQYGNLLVHVSWVFLMGPHFRTGQCIPYMEVFWD